MARYEYRVVPAPDRGKRAKGAKGAADRFAHALELLINGMAQDGWHYLRAETLPCEERTGLTGRSRTLQNVLIFRRDLRGAENAFAPDEGHDDRVHGLAADRSRDIAAVSGTALRDAAANIAPSLGAAPRADLPPRPGRPLGPARTDD